MKEPLINLRQLDTFLAVARTGSFHGAARELNSTQPAISSRIAQLEETLGVRLFERTTRSCRLTPRGHSLVSHAVRVFAATSDLKLAVGNSDVIAGVVRIGVVDTIAMTSLAALAKQVNTRYPLVDLQIDVNMSEALVRKLSSGALDLACVVAHTAPHGHIIERLSDPEFNWFVGRSFPMPKGKLTTALLATLPLLMHSGSQQADHVARWLRDVGAIPKRIHSCNSLEAIIRMTQVGIGLSVLPVHAVADYVQQGLLVPVPSDLPPFDNPLVMVRHHASVDPVVTSVAAIVRAVAGEADEAAPKPPKVRPTATRRVRA
jgi:DNA-binding transcriptional LysR family regulator